MDETDSVEQDNIQVDNIVEKEIRRRKRLFRTYTTMLVLPLIAVIAILLLGRSDRVMVASEVDTRIKPVEEKISETTPAIQQVHQQVSETAQRLAQQDAKIRTQIQSLVEKQNLISQRFPPKYEWVAVKGQLNEFSTNIRGYNDKMSEFTHWQSRSSEEFTVLSSKQAKLADEFTALSSRQASLEEELKNLTSLVLAVKANYHHDMEDAQKRIASLEEEIRRQKGQNPN